MCIYAIYGIIIIQLNIHFVNAICHFFAFSGDSVLKVSHSPAGGGTVRLRALCPGSGQQEQSARKAGCLPGFLFIPAPVIFFSGR